MSRFFPHYELFHWFDIYWLKCLIGDSFNPSSYLLFSVYTYNIFPSVSIVMHFSNIAIGLGVLASTVLAAPYKAVTSRQAASGLNVVYWGQNGGGVVENNDLSAYCATGSGIDSSCSPSILDYSRLFPN